MENTMTEQETAAPAGDGILNEDAAANLIMGSLIDDELKDTEQATGDASRAEADAERRTRRRPKPPKPSRPPSPARARTTERTITTSTRSIPTRKSVCATEP